MVYSVLFISFQLFIFLPISCFSYLFKSACLCLSVSHPHSAFSEYLYVFIFIPFHISLHITFHLYISVSFVLIYIFSFSRIIWLYPPFHYLYFISLSSFPSAESFSPIFSRLQNLFLSTFLQICLTLSTFKSLILYLPLHDRRGRGGISACHTCS